MDTRYFSFPKAAAVHRETWLEVGGLEPDTPYLLSGFPKRYRNRLWQRQLRTNACGYLSWTEVFTEVGEYLLDLFAVGAYRPATTVHVFVVPATLACRCPLRCDFHIHTYYSDGRQSPTEMAIRARELGLDVIAVTDHNRYAPSWEAISGVKRLGLSLIALPGEEVSFPTWHLLSIATSIGISELYDKPECQAEIANVEAELKGRELAGGLTPAEYAPLRWAIQKIHHHGGRAYLAHPYWIADRGRHLDLRLYDQLVLDDEFDGVELLGEVDYEDNLLSIAHYQDLLAEGHKVPIIGCSDTHSIEHTFGRQWTLVFAEEPTAEGVLRAIQGGCSVAGTMLGSHNAQETLRIFGPVNLVEYALYLERHFFPLHNDLCKDEAQLAYVALSGGVPSPPAMAECQEKMANLYRRCFPASR